MTDLDTAVADLAATEDRQTRQNAARTIRAALMALPPTGKRDAAVSAALWRSAELLDPR